jgi:hypothetical protein
MKRKRLVKKANFFVFHHKDSPLVCSRRWENRSRVNRRLMELALDREMSNIFHFMGGWISTHP